MSLFDSKNVSVKEKISSNSKYISFSITKEVSSAESVIKTYKSVSKIEGIISLQLKKSITFEIMIDSLEYNSERIDLIIPEYGRHIQKMVNQAVECENKSERNIL